MKKNNIDQFETIGDFLNWASEYFATSDIYYGHGTDNPWDEAVMLVLFVLQLPAENDISLLEQKLTVDQQEDLYKLARRRVEQSIPVPYLTNEAWFAGERYFVNEDVLIPRSPFAELILKQFSPWCVNEPKRILDMCTGSGCLAILCAKIFPQAQVDAVDISAAALEVARKNVVMHQCERNVELINSDLFTGLQGRKYDVIISNPPYVGLQEMQELPQEYKHEPELALASGVDGLDLTIRMLREAKQYLTEDGLIFVEVGNSWQALIDKYPQVEFVWLEFAHGGEGVFMLSAEQLEGF